MEPTLGIVNACLPVMGALLPKFREDRSGAGSYRTGPYALKIEAHTMELPSKGAGSRTDTRNFRRLGDDPFQDSYLSDCETLNVSEVTAQDISKHVPNPRGNDRVSHGGNGGAKENMIRNVITVRSSWDIRSDRM